MPKPIYLGVNVDHIATVRQARGTNYPDPVHAALLSEQAGADGIICSPQEAAAVRALDNSEGRLIVTPGVRPHGAELGDQKRVATPAVAINDGADHIVVGRPVWTAPEPRAAAQAIQREIAQAHTTNTTFR